MVYFEDVNLPIFHAINGFCGSSPFLDRVVALIDYPDLKGLVLVATFGAFWFRPGTDQLRVRRALLVALFAMALAIFAARVLAFTLPFEVRPMLMPDIGYRQPLTSKDFNYEAWSAFPSDQAAMMFALATGFWFASRPAGILVAIFSVIALLARVCLGIHYPLDVVVGALIGITAGIFLNYTHTTD
jgi:undecaprenyl-diphosphatase